MSRRGPLPAAELAAAQSGLKPFQQRTVKAVVDAMFDPAHPQRRFLVADEVGLGKTKVARAVVANTIEHLWNDDSIDRIDIVYVCSNHQIARQNIEDLRVLPGTARNIADRITMLPAALSDLATSNVNLVAFTPDTSLRLGSSKGRQDERAMLFHLLSQPRVLGRRILDNERAWDLMARGVKWFPGQVDWAQRTRIPKQVAAKFHERLEAEGLDRKFWGLVDRRKGRADEGRQSQFVGQLRKALAVACIDLLTPDLIILDEFQRFSTILDGQGEDGELANLLFSQSSARVLLLSATPYRMLTHAADDESHYDGFTRTVRFLLGDERAGDLEQLQPGLAELRRGVIGRRNLDDLAATRDRVQDLLRSVMVRTERLAATDDRDGMLKHVATPCAVAKSDVEAFIGIDTAARAIGVTPSMVEYWKSAPYLLNFMDDYQVKRALGPALDDETSHVRPALAGPHMLDKAAIERYVKTDPRNARLRWLLDDLDTHGAFDTLWVPPAMPQTELDGSYARHQDLTKRLVFSGWTVVPKAVAALASYEMERRHHRPRQLHAKHREFAGRLQLSKTQDRFTTLALLLPCARLADLGDPLRIAQQTGRPLPLPLEDVRAAVRAELTADLAPLLDQADQTGAARNRWYALAMQYLDPKLADLREDAWLGPASDRSRESGGLAEHVAHLAALHGTPATTWGRPPDELVDDLVEMAIASPAVCFLRALRRLRSRLGWTATDLDLARGAAHLAWAFRSLANTAEAAHIIAADAPDGEDFWRSLLRQAASGGLGSVLDEWFHLLPDQQRLQHTSPDPLGTVVMAAAAVMTLADGRVGADFYGPTRDADDSVQMRTHLVMRFGQARGATAEGENPVAVRNAFNSPFRPFVLVTTSVGQEGLDFHHYAHAVVHWNLPGNPVDLEQREGRVHRYKNHAVRKNVAARFGEAVELLDGTDPWTRAFELAESGAGDMSPWWVYPGPAAIERLVPTLPMSREVTRLPELIRATSLYRMTMGQPRQSELLEVLAGLDADEQDKIRQAITIDLAPR